MILLFCCSGIFAQTDYHFTIGEKELSGIDVYGINEDSLKTLWITTNNGLYSYDGYEFKNYSSGEQTNNSLFHPIFDQNGVLHCNNLSGQIFRVEKGQLTLVHQVPDSLLGSQVHFDFLPNNEMFVCSRGTYVLKEEGKQLAVISNNTPRSSPAKLHDGSFIIRDHQDRVLILEENKHTFHPWKNQITSISRFHQRMNGSLFEILDRSRFLEIDTIHNQVISKEFMELKTRENYMYATSENLWVAKATTGVQTINFDHQSLSDIFFTEHFISYVFEDSEENILLGTFKKGIIVIPKSPTELLEAPDQGQVSKICIGPSNTIFYGTNTGKVYRGDGEVFESTGYSSPRQIEHLRYFREEGLLFIDPFQVIDLGSGKLDNVKGGTSTKDYARMEEGIYLVGTQSQLVKVQIDKESVELLETYETGRTSKLAYNTTTKEIVVNTSKGLLVFDEHGIQTEILLDQKGFVVNDLVRYQDKILVATEDQGIMCLKGNSLEKFLHKGNSDLISNAIKQIEIQNDTLYVSHGNQLQVFSSKQQCIAVLGKSEGINFKIQDFAVDQNYIWISSNGNLSRLQKSFLSQPKGKISSDFLKIQSIEVLVNGKPTLPQKPIELEDEEIMFSIHAPSLSKSTDLTYEYKLNDETWNRNTFMDNTVRYQSLAFGEYELTFKLMFKGNEVDKKVIDFSVSTPFYYQAWFLLSIAVILILIAQLVYRNRLKVKTAQSQLQSELNMLKLNTLQSQMNPHFMFNALNSIQEYIITNEKKLAGKYLGKFAELMRIYLDHSQAQEVTIKEELHALKLYLDLEKLRFQDTLEYTVTIAQDVDSGFVIPSFLAQPYVENAIKHGLFHKEKDRRLWVSLSVEDNHLIYSIKDNGIGRTKSMAINHARLAHKSFATKATNNRLDLLNQGRSKPILVEVIDLQDKEGAPKGTLVTLKIPLSD